MSSNDLADLRSCVKSLCPECVIYVATNLQTRLGIVFHGTDVGVAV